MKQRRLNVLDVDGTSANGLSGARSMFGLRYQV